MMRWMPPLLLYGEEGVRFMVFTGGEKDYSPILTKLWAPVGRIGKKTLSCNSMTGSSVIAPEERLRDRVQWSKAKLETAHATHTAHAAHTTHIGHCGLIFLISDFSDGNLGRQQQTGDRGRIL